MKYNENLSLYFENSGAAVFKKHLLMAVFVMKNSHCN